MDLELFIDSAPTPVSLFAPPESDDHVSNSPINEEANDVTTDLADVMKQLVFSPMKDGESVNNNSSEEMNSININSGNSNNTSTSSNNNNNDRILHPLTDSINNTSIASDTSVLSASSVVTVPSPTAGAVTIAVATTIPSLENTPHGLRAAQQAIAEAQSMLLSEEDQQESEVPQAAVAIAVDTQLQSSSDSIDEQLISPTAIINNITNTTDTSSHSAGSSNSMSSDDASSSSSSAAGSEDFLFPTLANTRFSEEAEEEMRERERMMRMMTTTTTMMMNSSMDAPQINSAKNAHKRRSRSVQSTPQHSPTRGGSSGSKQGESSGRQSIFSSASKQRSIAATPKQRSRDDHSVERTKKSSTSESAVKRKLTLASSPQFASRTRSHPATTLLSTEELALRQLALERAALQRAQSLTKANLENVLYSGGYDVGPKRSTKELTQPQEVKLRTAMRPKVMMEKQSVSMDEKVAAIGERMKRALAAAASGAKPFEFATDSRAASRTRGESTTSTSSSASGRESRERSRSRSRSRSTSRTSSPVREVSRSRSQSLSSRATASSVSSSSSMVRSSSRAGSRTNSPARASSAVRGASSAVTTSYPPAHIAPSLTLTQPKEFTLSTSRRAKVVAVEEPAVVAANKKVSVTASMLTAGGVTQVKPFALSTSSTSSASTTSTTTTTPFISLASQAASWLGSGNDRATSTPITGALGAGQVTAPREFKLRTSTRVKEEKVLSTEERVMKEIEEEKKKKSVAAAATVVPTAAVPVLRSIDSFRAPAVTKPAPFSFSVAGDSLPAPHHTKLDKEEADRLLVEQEREQRRIALLKQAKGENGITKAQAPELNVLKRVPMKDIVVQTPVKSTITVHTDPSAPPTLTSPHPFNLSTLNRGLSKQDALAQKKAEADRLLKKQAEFHASSVPNAVLDGTKVFQPKLQQRRVLADLSPQLRSVELHKKSEEAWKEKIEKENQEEKEKRLFKAKPLPLAVLQQPNFIPQPSGIPLTKPDAAPKLSVEERAERREEYETELQQRMKKAEERKMMLEKERKEEEAKKLREFRESLVHHPVPVPMTSAGSAVTLKPSSSFRAPR